MKIIDLAEDKKSLFCLCLEDWSDDAKEAGPKRRQWLDRCVTSGERGYQYQRNHRHPGTQALV